MISRLGNVMMLLAIVMFVASTAWWLSFFYEVLGGDFQLARECFYWTTDLCALKETGALFADVPVYDPKLLWVAAAVFGAGVACRIIGARG